MSFKFSSGQTIDTYPKVLLHQVEEKKKNFYPNRLSFENYRMKLFFLFHFYPNLTKKKSKENFVLEIRSISQGGEGGGEGKRGICIRAVNPGSSVYDRAYSWRYRLLGTPMQLHNEVVTAIAAINLAEARVCMRTSDVSGKTGYGNACKSCNKSIIYI